MASKTHIKASGSTATISGVLRAGKTPIAHRLVWLYRVVKGKLVGGNGHFTNANGRAAFVVKPGSTTRYELKFFGGPKFLPTHSGIVTIVVVP